MSDEFRRMGPLAADHPAVGIQCAACRELITGGAEVTLMAIGPHPDDKENCDRAESGRPYRTQAALIHWHCRPRIGE